MFWIPFHQVTEPPTPSQLQGVLDSILVESMPLLLLSYFWEIASQGGLFQTGISGQPPLPPRPHLPPLHSGVSGKLCLCAPVPLFYTLGIPGMYGGFSPQLFSVSFCPRLPILNPPLHGFSSPAWNPTPTPVPATLGVSPHPQSSASPALPQLLENKLGLLMLKCLDVFF